MNSIFKLIFCFTVLTIASGETIRSDTNSQNDPVTEIYEFWKEQDKLFLLHERKDVVLFLGDTGVGKSTTALLVSNANLNATEDPDDSDEIILIDENDKIGHESSKSHTLIPNLLTDKANVVYYDCPGFKDTRSPKHELTIAFFLNKLMKYADSFKLVFVVGHESVQKRRSRDDFVDLVHNAVTLIKNIGNYSEGIGLVVTKVDSSKLTDAKVIEKVAKYLEEMKKSIAEEIAPNLPEDERKLKTDSIKFIEALLHKEDESYPRIGIFRSPTEERPILQAERTQLQTMINETLKYVRKDKDDFGFVISPKLENYIVNLTQSITQEGFGRDIENICRKIREFYQKKQTIVTDLTELHAKSTLGYDLLSAIKTEDPRLFIKELLNATYALEIAVSNATIEPILKHIKSIDFLMTVIPQTLTNKHTQKVNAIIKYLKTSQEWYGFFMYLEEELTDIDLQNDEMKSAARNIVKTLKTLEHGGNEQLINITKIGLEPLLERISNTKITYTHPNSNLNLVQLKALKNILDEYADDRLTAICSSNQLNMEVRGRVIKLSDVMTVNCYSTAKNIKIFALNKLIVDGSIDKGGQQAQIVIIAPTWDINEATLFNLDGENGKNHDNATASNGAGVNGHPDDGTPGEPGSRGSAGGNIWVIGSKFLHGERLTIQVNGGHGGDGQHGGSGSVEIEGISPPVPDETCPSGLKELWDAEKFDIHKFEHSVLSDETHILVHGKKGTKAGNGGDGGKQGDPGRAGKIMLFEMDQAAKMKIYAKDGAAGAIGKGGFGGKESENGKSYNITAYEILDGTAEQVGSISCSAKINQIIDNGKNDAGKDGIDNKNTRNMSYAIPPLEFNHPAYAVNEYKCFAREQSIVSSRKTEINSFLNQITNNEAIKPQYGALDLIDEFITMENQYFRMRGKIDFIPILESLLKRTDEFARKSTLSIEQKKALAFLYTAILSKINGINSKVFKNTVFNLNDYLITVMEKIQKLDNFIDDLNRIEVRNDFNALLNEKARSAKFFIETQITPELENVFRKIDDDIKNLIEESIQKQNDANEVVSTKKKRRRELQDKLRLQKILGPIKLIATAVSFFGPFGAATGAAISGGITVIDALAMDKSGESGNDKIIPLTSTDFKAKMAKVTETIKKRPEIVKKKLDDLGKYLTKSLREDVAPTRVSSKEIEKLIDEVAYYNAEIDKINAELAERAHNGFSEIPKDLMEQCKTIEGKLGTAAEEAKKKLEAKKPLSEGTAKEITEKQLRIVSHVQNVVSFVDGTVDFYNKIGSSEAKIEVVGDAIEGLQKDLAVLRDHEEKIHSALIPQVDAIYKNINEMSANLAGNSHVELDVKKWSIRSTLSEVRLLFSQMTADFAVHDSLGLSIDKLGEAMATLIDVYDRIDSYADNAKLTAYIENIVSHKSLETAIGDTELSDAVSKLKVMIQSNIVLEEYEMATHAFKQHYFPIANYLMTGYLKELPPSLQMNDTNAIIEKSTDEIEKIMDKIALSKAMQSKYSSAIHPSALFIGGDGAQPPLCTWKYHEYKDQIKSLLQGEEITIKADVTRGINQNAVTFNTIGIRFKLFGDKHGLQSELNNILSNLIVNMTMVGTTYYRCNNRYYQIPLDENIDIKFAYKMDANGKQMDPNGNYNEILANAPFLSPYVMWTINLSGDRLNELRSFVDQILDLELIGSGQYLEHGPFSNEICNDQLDKYYHFDPTISNLNTLVLSKDL